MPLEIVNCDITKMKVDAIVNAANTALKGAGTGVDGSIHMAAGPLLQRECDKLKGCPVGFAKVTRGYGLPCRYVIHTVGPVWNGGFCGEREALESCYRSSLQLAKKKRCKSVAFPIISSGAYGYPRAEALEVARQCISEFLQDNEMQVYIAVYERNMVELSGGLRSQVDGYLRRVYLGSDTIRFDLSAPAENRGMPTAASAAHEKPEPAAVEYESFSMPAESPDFIEEMAPPLCAAVRFDPAEGFRELDESFAQSVFRLIDKKGMSDPECYRRANISRAVFSTMRTNTNYKPSKQTALALAVALELSLEETRALLEKAGYAISHSHRGDVIVEYFIQQGCYDVFAINEVLFAYDQSLLGNCRV